ncbi:MAG: pyruvate kinase [Candidatus Pacebacteria bacterium]|nr:pyruvate kinase [Candidatus Paceibacterota bacterium]
MIGKFIIARHHESEWNRLGKWTGNRDRHLTDFGFEKSKEMGVLIKDLRVDCAFASMQVRSIETLSCILGVREVQEVPTEHSAALNERDYGEYTGKNKWEMENVLGEEEFKKLRRGWDCPIKNGESLKMVYDRAVPYFLDKILPKVKEGKNVLAVAHGNSLRTIIKYIENISDEGIADVEMPFGAIIIYDLDENGHMTDKVVLHVESHSKAQIVATIGPASGNFNTLRDMIEYQLDVARFNFSWGDFNSRVEQIKMLRQLEKGCHRHIPIIVDLPGPRIQKKDSHTYNPSTDSLLTENDKESIKFAVEQNADYIAVSFVGGPQDIEQCRGIIKGFSGEQKIIAKIERALALESLDQIIAVSDAIMVARGDLGNEVPLEQIPFIQADIIRKCKEAGKPVITATQMLLSMVEHPTPTRAEVTDVANAIFEGSDAVMLSEETANGKYPVQAVSMMEKIAVEVERHMGENIHINHL